MTNGPKAKEQRKNIDNIKAPSSAPYQMKKQNCTCSKLEYERKIKDPVKINNGEKMDNRSMNNENPEVTKYPKQGSPFPILLRERKLPEDIRYTSHKHDDFWPAAT